MKAGAAGGIDAAVKAINTHIDNVGVCEQGCWALWNMTVNNGKNTDKYNKNSKMNRWEQSEGRSSRRN